MPIYEYECSDCGHTFDKFQQMSDPDPDECPECQTGEVQRLVSESSFHLKGGGWFDDGYSSTSGDAGTDDSTGGADKTSTSSDTGGDSEAAAE